MSIWLLPKFTVRGTHYANGYLITLVLYLRIIIPLAMQTRAFEINSSLVALLLIFYSTLMCSTIKRKVGRGVERFLVSDR